MSRSAALAALLGAFSLAVPTPPAIAATMTLSLCGGGTINLPVGDGAPAGDGNCCPKACHACQERKGRKSRGERDGCC